MEPSSSEGAVKENFLELGLLCRRPLPSLAALAGGENTNLGVTGTTSVAVELGAAVMNFEPAESDAVLFVPAALPAAPAADGVVAELDEFCESGLQLKSVDARISGFAS